MYIDSHEETKFQLFRELIGDSRDFQNLYFLAHMTTKQSPVDHKLVEIYLKTAIARLP